MALFLRSFRKFGLQQSGSVVVQKTRGDTLHLQIGKEEVALPHRIGEFEATCLVGHQ